MARENVPLAVIRKPYRPVSAPPGDVAAEVVGDTIEVTWEPPEHAVAFAVYRSAPGEEPPQHEDRVAWIEEPAYVDANAVAGISYHYRVRAIGPASFWSDFSAPASAEVPA